MKLAYLLNTYPLISTTFIRREIEAIEAQGQAVSRFAVRRPDTPLVDPDDIAEQARTEYLLSGNLPMLLRVALSDAILRLPALIAVLPLWWHLYRQAGGIVRHVSYLMQAMLFRRRARALGIDHVHAHFSTNAAGVAMLAHALGGPGYSFTVHGPDELVAPTKNAMARKVEKARFVVAITDYCKGRIAAEAPAHAHKIIVIHCGIDLRLFPFSMPDPAVTTHFVCVGRLCENKAQALIPAAVAQVRGEFPGITVELVGGGDYQSVVEAEVDRHDVRDNIRFSGWASGDVVRERINASSALLLPSLAEGLPIVLMEAMALGRPVLTTQIAGIPELVDDGCGWIFPSGSVESLAAALRNAAAISPVTRNAKIAEGRRRIEQRHDIHLSASALIKAFAARGAVQD